MHKLLGAGRTVPMKRALLIASLAAAALFASAGDGAAVSIEPMVVGDGGCIVCPFFDNGDYGMLSLTRPENRCGIFSGSQGLACAGWNYWDRTRVWKASGGWIRVGFWYRAAGGLPTMAYRIFGDSFWNGRVITVDRTEVGAPAYNASTCAYDYVHGGPASSVFCEAIDW